MQGGRAGRLRSWLGTGILLLVSLAASALLAEAVLRIAPPPSMNKRRIMAAVGHMNPPRLMVPDREIGWFMAPGFEGAARGREWQVAVRTNSLGLRDAEPDPSARRRVLVLGDSYVYGFGVEAEETFPKVAEATLRSSGRPDVAVLNAGVSGYGPLEELALLRRLAGRIGPQVVVLAFFEGNDVQNALEHPKRYVMGDDGYLHTPEGGPSPAGRSHLLAYVRRKLRGVSEKMEAGKGLELARQAVREARRHAEASGAEFLLVLIPTTQAERIGRPRLLRAYDRILGQPPDVNAVMEDFARREGIRVLNLSPVFDGAADESSLRFGVDGHFTREGHRLAGEALAAALEPVLGAP